MNLTDEKDRLHLRQCFEQTFLAGPGTLKAALAPGRVNLIGEHTDYNGGLVLPIAIGRHTAVVFRPKEGTHISVYSESIAATSQDALPQDDIAFDKKITKHKEVRLHWANYVRGVAASLQRLGIKLKGGELYITGDLPNGAGLSSSASLEVAVALALLDLAGKTLPPQKLALACQWAEHNYAGVRCGIMDQTVVVSAKAGHALLLDCKTLKHTHVPIRLKEFGFAIFDTGVRHELAGSEYNKRRSECEHAATTLGVKTLRDVTVEVLLKKGGKLTSNEQKRLRHLLGENIRVAQFANALGNGDTANLAWILMNGHHSLQHAYEVSCVELDLLAHALWAPVSEDLKDASLAARMTGGGFGGAVVALIRPEKYLDLLVHLTSRYGEEAGRELGGALLLEPVDGAMVYAL